MIWAPERIRGSVDGGLFPSGVVADEEERVPAREVVVMVEVRLEVLRRVSR